MVPLSKRDVCIVYLIVDLIDVKNKNSTNINNFFYNEFYEQIFSNHFSILFSLKNEISFFTAKKFIEKQTKNYPLILVRWLVVSLVILVIVVPKTKNREKVINKGNIRSFY